VEKRVCGGDERRVKTLTELIASARADISRAELHENFKRWKFGYVCNLTGGAAEIGQAATIGTTQGQTVGRCVGRFVARIKQQPRLASIPALYAKILCGSKALFAIGRFLSRNSRVALVSWPSGIASLFATDA